LAASPGGADSAQNERSDRDRGKGGVSSGQGSCEADLVSSLLSTRDRREGCPDHRRGGEREREGGEPQGACLRGGVGVNITLDRDTRQHQGVHVAAADERGYSDIRMPRVSLPWRLMPALACKPLPARATAGCDPTRRVPLHTSASAFRLTQRQE